jgi:hypothetical protein
MESQEEMEKRLVSRLNIMYSILPDIYLEVVELNFPELQKYMRYANIYPFKCIVRYRYGVDLMKKGLIRDTFGEASVYFKPIPYGEDLAARVERGDPSISEEELLELSVEYTNNLKSMGRYSNNKYFHIFMPSVSEIINDLSLSNALYALINEDLEWLLNDNYVSSKETLVLG